MDIPQIKKSVLLLLIFAFLIRIAFLFYSPMRGWDETVYLNLGYDLFQNPLHYSLADAKWSDFIPSAEPVYSSPNIGFRAPLLPYILSLFYAFNLKFLIPLFMPVLGALSVLLVYILGKRLFDDKTALYSATLFALVPAHVFYSGRIWTDPLVVFFMLLAFISFWQGYEKGIIKHKMLFGFFLALSLLARYTTLWITPVFLFYFLLRDKSLRFLKDKHLWQAIGIFFLAIIPWLIYGLAYYGNPLGGFIHGFKASSYWGGVQSWSFFFTNSWQIFSVIGVLFMVSLLYVLCKKEFLKREIYLLLIWIIFFGAIVMAMPHKEERFILPVIPAVCLLAGFFLSRIKRYGNILFVLVCAVLAVSLWGMFKIDYQNSQAGVNTCFAEGNKFLTDSHPNSLVITNQLPIVRYYTGKEVRLYPDLWSLEALRNVIDLNDEGREVYIFFANYDMHDKKIKEDLDTNFKKVFECERGWGNSAIYLY